MNKTHLVLLTLVVASLVLAPSVYAEKGGTPFNELWDAISDIADRVTVLEGITLPVDELWDAINGLVPRVTALESSSPFSHPDYDSGWVSITLGYTDLYHYLGTTDVYVYILGRNGAYTHQIAYGSDWVRNSDTSLSSYGVYWKCYPNRLQITRWMDDIEWQEVRVLIWKLPAPPT